MSIVLVFGIVVVEHVTVSASETFYSSPVTNSIGRLSVNLVKAQSGEKHQACPSYMLDDAACKLNILVSRVFRLNLMALSHILCQDLLHIIPAYWLH